LLPFGIDAIAAVANIASPASANPRADFNMTDFPTWFISPIAEYRLQPYAHSADSIQRTRAIRVHHQRGERGCACG
jgi:hypothetical protein